MRLPSLLIVAAMSLSTVLGQQPPPTSTVLVGGTLIDVRNGWAVENTAVLITGDRIIQIGAKDKLQIPSDARTIDARGKWILHGLIDMHVHMWDSEVLPLELFLANGITTIRDTGFSVLVMRLLEADLSSGKRIGPRLFFCGDLLDADKLHAAIRPSKKE